MSIWDSELPGTIAPGSVRGHEGQDPGLGREGHRRDRKPPEGELIASRCGSIEDLRFFGSHFDPSGDGRATFVSDRSRGPREGRDKLVLHAKSDQGSPKRLEEAKNENY
jgi:hypothetical protein